MTTNQLPKEAAKEQKKTKGKPDEESSWMYPFKSKALPHKGGIGFAKAAYTRLLFEKLNFTEEEIEKISNSSDNFCKRSAQKFEEESRKIKFNEEYSELIRRRYPPLGLTIWGGGDHPFPPGGGLPSHVDFYIPSDQNFQYGHAHAEGKRTGSISLDEEFEQSINVKFEFNFTPPFTTRYNFNTEVWAFGSYYVIADDGSCDSKEASVRMYTNIKVVQVVPKVRGKLGTPEDILYLINETQGAKLYFEAGGQNINRFEPIFDRNNFGTNDIFLYQNEPVKITVNAVAVAYARGSGSHSDINCLQGHGGISCDGLRVKSA